MSLLGSSLNFADVVHCVQYNSDYFKYLSNKKESAELLQDTCGAATALLTTGLKAVTEHQKAVRVRTVQFIFYSPGRSEEIAER